MYYIVYNNDTQPDDSIIKTGLGIRWFFDKKEQIALSLFIKERIALLTLFVKSNEIELLLSLFCYRETRVIRSCPLI